VKAAQRPHSVIPAQAGIPSAQRPHSVIPAQAGIPQRAYEHSPPPQPLISATGMASGRRTSPVSAS
jgi:hypothetical protein